MKVGITHGDFNGANYEILLKIFEDPRMVELFTPVVYGLPQAAAHYSRLAGTPPPEWKIVTDAAQAKAGALNMVDIAPGETFDIQPGKATPEAGQAARAALAKAVADLKEGKIDVMVTAPIDKNTIQSDEFHFPGHTEYLARELATDSSPAALMVLCNDTLRVALVTSHVPLSAVAPLITRQSVLDKLRLFNHTLLMDFTLPHPRIAVLALNPHASDGGVMGNEEADAIEPAIADAQAEGIEAYGPYAADGFFGSGAYRHFDGVLAMYHDQGLAPFKTLAMHNGVNFTAGLSHVRTSPDHGTARDLAGTGRSDEQSMRAAIYAAIDIKRNRDTNSLIFANPLKKLYNTTQNNRE